jgi:hypothetical protein
LAQAVLQELLESERQGQQVFKVSKELQDCRVLLELDQPELRELQDSKAQLALLELLDQVECKVQQDRLALLGPPELAQQARLASKVYREFKVSKELRVQLD